MKSLPNEPTNWQALPRLTDAVRKEGGNELRNYQ